MSIAFALASLWSVVCSTIGGLCASALAHGCPACSPVLRCPALSCHCGGGLDLVGRTAPDTTCSAAGGCPWQLVAASYAAGLVTAALVTLSFRLWVEEAPAAKRGLGAGAPLCLAAAEAVAGLKCGSPAAAAAVAAGAAGVTPRRSPPAPVVPERREVLPAAALPPAAASNDGLPVWRPRRP